MIGSPVGRLATASSSRIGGPAIVSTTSTWPWIGQNLLSVGPNRCRPSPWQVHYGSISSGGTVSNATGRAHVQPSSNRSPRTASLSGNQLNFHEFDRIYAWMTNRFYLVSNIRCSLHAVRTKSKQQCLPQAGYISWQ